MSQLPNPVVIFSTGIALLLLSIVFGFILAPKFIRDQIAEQVQLRNGTEVFDKWMHVPIPIYFKVYIFNVTNPIQVTEGQFPKLSEIGPFVYRELREKISVQEFLSNGTVKYKERVTFFFDHEKSNGLNEDIQLTILNVPHVAMSQKVAELPFPINELALSYIIKFKEKPFIKKTVREILFQGWQPPILSELADSLDLSVMPNNTFGIFYGKNGTDDGFLEVDSGIKNLDNFGKILSHKGETELKWWKNGSHCNELLGTDGSIFPPFVSKKRVIRIFTADLCRSLYLTFQKETTLLGIPAYRFTPPKEMLEDPRTNKDNQCYCLESEIENCLPGGAIDLSVCRDGAPVAMSTPHFHEGNEGYQKKTGLKSDFEKHATIIDIEPITGIVLRAHKRIQVNILTKPVKEIRSLSKLPAPEMLFPILWADESAEIDEDIAQQLKSHLINPLIALEITKWTVFGVSILLIFSASVRWFSRPPARPDSEVEERSNPETNKILKSSILLNDRGTKIVKNGNGKENMPFIT